MTQTTAPSATQRPLVVNANGQTIQGIDSKTAIAIINKRATLKMGDAGLNVQLIIQGKGQHLAKGHKYSVNGVDRENGFDRTIYNLRANSAIAMAANKTLFTDALKAESAGETQKAHELFNEYLNVIQISFSVIENGLGTERRFDDGDVVKAIVGTAVNASGATAIIVDNVREVAAVAIAPTKFSVDDLMEA